jgi:hypothetical protein
MNIYKFRVILDVEEDVFRDIEIGTESSFEELHEAILHAFDFDGGEMASFYMSNEDWDKGEEITLLDMAMAEGQSGGVKTMASVKLEDMVKQPSEKILYVYDFLRMWCFYIELMAHRKAAPSTLYPRVGLVYGDAPAEDSKEIGLMDGLDLFEGEDTDDKKGGKKGKTSTGDPELDEYLDDEEDFEEGGFDNLDDLDDSYY